jgi:hypothetical protein
MLDTQLLRFLENKPADARYDYKTPSCCAAAQFNQSIGRTYRYFLAMDERVDRKTFDGRLETVARQEPWTFGAMLDRARKEFA